MANQAAQVDQDTLRCSLCWNQLTDPVTIPCGHSYCRSCIEWYWERDDENQIYKCPDCRHSFEQRPVLVSSQVLEDEMEEQEVAGSQSDPDDRCSAGSEDVDCDFCTPTKRKASMTCLQCQVSYCEQHLQPHYEVPPLKKHTLLEASTKLQEIVCSRHNEVMKVFCRTDQQCVCYLCAMDEHKGHNTVSAEAEMTRKQSKFRASLQKVKQGIQDREECLKVLEKEVDALSSSAEKAVEASEKMSTELVRLIEQNAADFKKQITSQQKVERKRALELTEKQRKELTELRRKGAKFDQLLNTTHATMFLQNAASSSNLQKNVLRVNFRPLQHFEDVATALSEATDHLKDKYMKEWSKISKAVIEGNGLEEPKTKVGFAKFSFPFKLDPNTTNAHLLLGVRKSKVTAMKDARLYPTHPERFVDKSQIVSSDCLTGRCYWEVVWSGLGAIVAVTYKDISRAGDDSAFGNNDRSWAVESTFNGTYLFKHDGNTTSVEGPRSFRIGVFVDPRAGVLSFYSVCRTVTLLHRVQTTFTQPLYAGLSVRHYGATASLNFPKK